ncbi:MAG: hypothetical protein Q8J94_00425 [Thiobacillus sp.]|nr:hypothetical protein [Thiobacillus sp.]
MTYWKEFLVISCSLILTACGGEEAAAKKAVLADLKDPSSAKFGDFRLLEDGAACFEVNARNSFGGYTGASYMALIKMEGQWVALTASGSFQTCEAVAKEMLKRTKSKS